MKSNHLTMLVAALSLSVSPLATLPAAAQVTTTTAAATPDHDYQVHMRGGKSPSIRHA
ncbi:hypothetical protein [Rhizobium leguminosarum]|uniref:hypothetical protein n=1 Tax=Rhizobium leguminosarum TaxID=384 RepID=UPI003F9BE089